jgi:hypothetical protein
LNFQSKKIADFNEEQAEIISARIIQKLHTIRQSLKDDDTMVDESIEWIEKVFKIGLATLIREQNPVLIKIQIIFNEKNYSFLYSSAGNGTLMEQATLLGQT